MVKLLSKTENLTQVIATAARVCYSGLPLNELLTRYSEKEQVELVKRVVSMGHLSVVEHAVLTFEVEGSLKEELFEILCDKPFIKVSPLNGKFVVSANLRTLAELALEKPHLKFTEKAKEFLPDYLKEALKL